MGHWMDKEAFYKWEMLIRGEGSLKDACVMTKGGDELASRQASPPSPPHPLLSYGCLSPPQSSILDLADIFAPAPALPSTHCSADPWDIPGGHAGLQEPPPTQTGL